MAAPADERVGLDRRGATVALASGIIAAAGMLAGTVLYLLGELDVIADAPRYQTGNEDVEAQLAANTVAYLERQHDVWWNIALRDSLLPVAFLALMVLVAVAAERVRWNYPAALMVVFFVVGGLLNIVNDLMYLGQLHYWRHTGWETEPPGPVIAVGTASDAVVAATTYLEAASYVVLLLGAVSLGWLCRNEHGLPRWLGTFSYAEAVGLLLLTVGIAAEMDPLYQVAGALTGIVLGPLVALTLGRHLSRA